MLRPFVLAAAANLRIGRLRAVQASSRVRNCFSTPGVLAGICAELKLPAPTISPPPFDDGVLTISWMRRPAKPRGLKAIIVYKFIKAPVMLALAIALSVAPVRAVSAMRHVAVELSESGSLGWHAARWLKPFLTLRAERRAALLAWLDAASTLAEGLLLLSGSAWGEWIVVAALALLIPPEAAALIRHPRPGRALLLLVNGAVVAYLLRLRLNGLALPRRRAA